MVCQLVGIGLVPRYVMTAIGLEGTMGWMELLCLIEIIVLIASKKIIGIITVEINN